MVERDSSSFANYLFGVDELEGSRRGVAKRDVTRAGACRRDITPETVDEAGEPSGGKLRKLAADDARAAVASARGWGGGGVPVIVGTDLEVPRENEAQGCGPRSRSAAGMV